MLNSVWHGVKRIYVEFLLKMSYICIQIFLGGTINRKQQLKKEFLKVIM